MELHDAEFPLAPPTREVEEAIRQTLMSGGTYRFHLRNSVDAIIARATIRRLAETMGYSLIDQVRLGAAFYEIAHNIVAYAGQAGIIISWRENDHLHKGLHVFCNDCGLNRTALSAVLQTGDHDARARLNHPNLKKLVDELEVSQTPEEGNCVTMIKWLA